MSTSTSRPTRRAPGAAEVPAHPPQYVAADAPALVGRIDHEAVHPRTVPLASLADGADRFSVQLDDQRRLAIGAEETGQIGAG